MSLSKLPTLAEMRAHPSATPKRDEPTRRDVKRAKLATLRKVDRVARNIAWKRCKGHCEKCQKRITRGGGLLDGAEFHHRVPRSKGGKHVPVYLVLCKGCHFDGPSGAHTRTR